MSKRIETPLATVHAALAAVLVATRPLVWDGDFAAPANIAWHVLLGVALLVVAAELALGMRKELRWSWGWPLAAAALACLLPAALRADVVPTALGSWSGWLGCLLFAAYLMQVAASHAQAIIAGLIAALVGQALIVAGQVAWVLPAMAQAQSAGSPAFAGMGASQGDVAERIANGGCFGTFTLANTLASWTALVALPLTAAAWLRGHRLIAGVIGFAAVLMLLGAGAKGIVPALAAGALVAWWHGGRWRWAAPALAAAAIAVVVCWPQLTGASGAVRLGYWQGAWELIRERPLLGHGLDGFAVHFPRVMAVDAEPARLVHNGVLEAWVAGGVLAALLTAAWLASTVLRRPLATPPPPTAECSPWAIAGALGFAVPYLALLGAFDGNLGWWPGGLPPTFAAAMWSLPLGAAMAAAAIVALRLDLRAIPGWAATAALGAAVIMALINFDLHSAGLVGTLAAVAVLAAGPGRGLTAARWSAAPWLAAVAAAGFAVVVAVQAAAPLRQAEDLVGGVSQLPHLPAEVRLPALAELAERADLPPDEVVRDPAAGTDRILAAAAAAAHTNPGLTARALALRRPTPPVAAAALANTEAHPHSSAAWLVLAQIRAAVGDAPGAITAAAAARALSPRSVGAWRLEAALCRNAADRGAGDATALRQRAVELDATADRLAGQVHPRNR